MPKTDTGPPVLIQFPTAQVLASQRLACIDTIDKMSATPTSTVEERKLIHSIVHRIEIDPYAKQGTLYLPKDAFEIFKNNFCSRASAG